MQPEDKKSDFQKPDETHYYPPAKPEPIATDFEPNLDSGEPVPVEAEAAVETEDKEASDRDQPDENSEASAPLSLPETEPVRWEAPEYIHQDKGTAWFIGFAAIGLFLMVVAVFLQAWTFVALIPVMFTALFLYTRRPSQTVSYVLSAKGLYINDALHPIGEFKSFGVIHDEHEFSVALIPVRRFRPSLTVYFPEEVGEQVVDLLGARLPMRQLHRDALDKIINFLKI